MCLYGGIDGDNKASYIITNFYTGEIIHKIYSVWFGEWAKEKPWFYYTDTNYNPETGKTVLRIQEYNVETDKTQTVYEETGVAGLAKIYAPDQEHMLFEIWDDFSHWRYVSVNINTHEVHAFNQKAAELIYAGKIGKKIYFISKERDNHGEVIALQMDQTVDQAEVIRKASNDSLNSGFILGGKLYILAQKDVAAKMYCIDEQEEKEIALPDPMGTASYVSENEDEVILGFESFIMPKGYFTFDGKEMLEYMLSYSPYHNVKFTNYPATYIQTGELDNNVPPYHGKKFAASMQAHNQNTTPILLRVLAKGSHNRGSGDEYWKTVAEMQLFIEKSLGI